MKKLLLAACLIFAMAMPIMAEEAQPIEWAKFGINLSGDTVYLLNSGKIVAGLGLSPVTFVDGAFDLRLEYTNTLTGDMFSTDMVGLFVQADIVKALKMIPNSQWLLPDTNIKIGIGYMTDIEDFDTGEPALVISIIKLY